MSEYASPTMSGRLLYHVTLASGRVVTSPEGFGSAENEPELADYFRPIFSEDGRLLTLAADTARRAASPARRGSAYGADVVPNSLSAHSGQNVTSPPTPSE